MSEPCFELPGVRADGDGWRVPHALAERVIDATFVHAGCEASEAKRIATRLVGANLRGHDSHGIIRAPRYVEWIDSGRVVRNQHASVESDSGAIVIVDGHYGFGQVVGEEAVDIGIERARRDGVAVVALKNAGHLGRIGEWAERAAAANIASIHMVNVRGSLLVAPFGGVERRLSTSPFCCGMPNANGEPLILDFATSLVAEGKALVALKGGRPLPDGALISADGELSADPAHLYGELEPGRYPDPNLGPGALTGFGLHKGSGLNIFMEVFAGVLTGSGTAGGLGEPQRRRFCNGMLSIYLGVERFRSDDALAADLRGLIEFVKSARPAEPGGEVLVPGERERRTLAERSRDGLPLSTDAWRDIVGAAVSAGVDLGALGV